MASHGRTGLSRAFYGSVAAGSRIRLLDVPGEREFMGKGLSYSAVNYAPLFVGKKTVAEAVIFFQDADENLFDGYQTAREVVSHLVFWHREYATILQIMLNGHQPPLKSGSFALLNAKATQEFKDLPLPELAALLSRWQKTLDTALRQLPNWQMRLQTKHECHCWRVANLVPHIEAHIRQHVDRLKRAKRHGQEWIRAYFKEKVAWCRPSKLSFLR